MLANQRLDVRSFRFSGQILDGQVISLPIRKFTPVDGDVAVEGIFTCQNQPVGGGVPDYIKMAFFGGYVASADTFFVIYSPQYVDQGPNDASYVPTVVNNNELELVVSEIAVGANTLNYQVLANLNFTFGSQG